MNSNIMLSNNMILVFQRLCNKPSISTKFLWTKGSLCSEGFVQGRPCFGYGYLGRRRGGNRGEGGNPRCRRSWCLIRLVDLLIFR